MKTYPMRAKIRDEGGATRVDIYDDIGAGFWSDGVTPASFAAQMSGIRGPLDVHISSGGGDVFDGIAIAEAIRNHPGQVTTYVDGIAASIASVIAQAGQRRVMARGSMMMIHDAWGYPDEPNEAGLLKMAATLGKISDNLASQYAQRAGGTPEQWRQAMQAESWYTADEAVAAGLADSVAADPAQLPQGLDVDALAARAPVRVMAALRSMPKAAAPVRAASGDETPVCLTCDGRGTVKHPKTGQKTMQCPGCKGTGLLPDDSDGGQPAPAASGGSARNEAQQLGNGWVQDPDGRQRFDPDGDGDDDSTPEGDTDHDYFAPDGTPIKPVPPCPVTQDWMRQLGVSAELWQQIQAAISTEVARLSAADSKVDNSPWDASKAWSAGSAADDPAKFFAGICAGEKTTGDPGTQAHWALPYRYSPDDPPNAAAVRNCLARLAQTQDLNDPDGTKKKLEGLMKQVNPDYEPEDHDTSDISGDWLEQYRAALKGAQ